MVALAPRDSGAGFHPDYSLARGRRRPSSTDSEFLSRVRANRVASLAAAVQGIAIHLADIISALLMRSVPLLEAYPIW